MLYLDRITWYSVVVSRCWKDNRWREIFVTLKQEDEHIAELWKVKQSHYRLDRNWGFQKDEAPRLQDNRHMKVAWLSARSTGRLYSFLLEAESTLGPWCGWKDYVNEKFQWHHRESIPVPQPLRQRAPLLGCSETRKWRMESVHEKWLIVIEGDACNKILSCNDTALWL
jgi:hypothetical protein